jgi:hypothetical protein
MRHPTAFAHATRAATAGITLAVVLAAAPSPAAAADLLEPPRPRQGYYFALGYSFALNKNWEGDKTWGVWPGTELKIRMGQLVTRRFGLGLQIHTGGAAGQGQQSAFGGLTMEGQFEVAHNLAVYGGIGVDVVSLTSQHMEDKTTRGAVGSGYYLGTSYDWFFTKRLTGGWAVAPTIEARLVPGTTATGFIAVVGVQIVYWTGLPKNQLDLPPGEAFKR